MPTVLCFIGAYLVIVYLTMRAFVVDGKTKLSYIVWAFFWPIYVLCWVAGLVKALLGP